MMMEMQIEAGIKAAKKRAYEARVKEMIEAGVDKEMARTLAKVEIEYELITPVVYGN